MTAPTETPAAALALGLRELVLSADHFRILLAGTLGLSVAELTALGDLRHEGDLKPRDMAQRLSLSSGGLTALVDRLERIGYVIRLPHPTDRRSLLVHLTPQGDRATAWVFDQFRVTLETVLTPDDQDDQVFDLLIRAGTALRAATAPEPKSPE